MGAGDVCPCRSRRSASVLALSPLRSPQAAGGEVRRDGLHLTSLLRRCLLSCAAMTESGEGVGGAGDEALVVETFAIGSLGCNCSLVYERDSRRAIVIDPGDDPEALLQAVGGARPQGDAASAHPCALRSHRRLGCGQVAARDADPAAPRRRGAVPAAAGAGAAVRDSGAAAGRGGSFHRGGLRGDARRAEAAHHHPHARPLAGVMLLLH